MSVCSILGNVREKYNDSVPTLPVRSQTVLISYKGSAESHCFMLRISDDIFLVKYCWCIGGLMEAL